MKLGIQLTGEEPGKASIAGMFIYNRMFGIAAAVAMAAVMTMTSTGLTQAKVIKDPTAAVKSAPCPEFGALTANLLPPVTGEAEETVVTKATDLTDAEKPIYTTSKLTDVLRDVEKRLGLTAKTAMLSTPVDEIPAGAMSYTDMTGQMSTIPGTGATFADKIADLMLGGGTDKFDAATTLAKITDFLRGGGTDYVTASMLNFGGGTGPAMGGGTAPADLVISYTWDMPMGGGTDKQLAPQTTTWLS